MEVVMEEFVGKALVGASLGAQVFYIMVAGGTFGDPGRPNMAALLLICGLTLSMVIVGSAIVIASRIEARSGETVKQGSTRRARA
jgi:hypothetical protein